MVMMDAALDLTGQMQGGLCQALLRRVANRESFFQQRIQATRGDGDCLLAPQLPGALQVLDVGNAQYCLSDGAYVAASGNVQVTARSQNHGNTLFGGTGGFFIGETSGNGQLVVSGFGSVFTLDVMPGKEIIIDNAHVIAWDKTLNFKISTATAQGRGFLGSLVNSVTSGEGLVLRFSGQGKVIVCSRNRSGFLAWLAMKLNRNN
jgi:uncharacterized protein (TIGR00266 family)